MLATIVSRTHAWSRGGSEAGLRPRRLDPRVHRPRARSWKTSAATPLVHQPEAPLAARAAVPPRVERAPPLAVHHRRRRAPHAVHPVGRVAQRVERAPEQPARRLEDAQQLGERALRRQRVLPPRQEGAARRDEHQRGGPTAQHPHLLGAPPQSSATARSSTKQCHDDIARKWTFFRLAETADA